MARRLRLGLASATVLLASCSAAREEALVGTPPLVIAHRGASGDRPEHTLEAYKLAIAQGADYIEPDLVLTKDGVLVARHENEISTSTDVADRPEYASRKTTKTIDGVEATGWFTEDFTLAELKTLRARERIPQLRSTAYDGRFGIPTFEEILQLVRAEEARSGRRIGIVPETKHPSYFAALGLPHTPPMLSLLGRYGYEGEEDPVLIQSFEIGNLEALHGATRIRLVQLISDQGGPSDRPDRLYADMTSAEGLASIARYADAIGPGKDLVIKHGTLGGLDGSTGLVARAHRAGLAVYPWTFRAENYFLPTDHWSGLLPSSRGDLAGEVRAFAREGVDGLFCDHPGLCVAALGGK